MKPADLRATVDAMTDPAPWRQGNFERYNLFVHDGDALGGPVLGERVLLKANTHFPHVENLAGIAAIRNHATALLDVVELAARLVDGNQPQGEQHAVRVALRCALAKLEEIR